MSPIRIGTRASKLARAQAQTMADALAKAQPGLAVEIIAMSTAGDREVHKHIADWGYKGLFTKELEDALLEDRIDIAVHSVKDMPSELPDGLTLAAMLPRADARDAWVSPRHASLDDLPKGATVGTSSARRAAQVLHRRRDLALVPLRGNVETRLRKIDEGDAEGTFLAVAGLERLGLSHHARELIEPEVMLPAAAQGAIGAECRADDAATRELLARVNHAPTFTCVAAERAYLQALDGSCRTPIAGLATLTDDVIQLRGEVLSLDGTVRHYKETSGAAVDAETLGDALGRELRAVAGDVLVHL